jgi:hypothetical protein
MHHLQAPAGIAVQMFMPPNTAGRLRTDLRSVERSRCVDLIQRLKKPVRGVFHGWDMLGSVLF